jgi:hypothetical protein
MICLDTGEITMSCPHCTDEPAAEAAGRAAAAPPGTGEVTRIAGLSDRPPYVLPTPAKQSQGYVVLALMLFGVGLLTGYLIRGPVTIVSDAPRPLEVKENQAQAAAQAAAAHPADETHAPATSLIDQVNPIAGYTLPAVFGDVGPQMMAAGAIDYDKFTRVYDQAGQPLTAVQQTILTQGSQDPVHIDRDNAYFLLNFFWALGLVNDNPLLTEGPLVEYSEGRLDRYAATGGWTIGQKPPIELIASASLLHLNHEQQERLEEVANQVYRPCCNNHTAFADCNHGMALLGLLQLMAAQDATVLEMFDAAKYVNAFWFPQQTLHIATFFQLAQGLNFADVDARLLVGPQISSASGYQNVQQWLASSGGLEQAPGGGNRCGV